MGSKVIADAVLESMREEVLEFVTHGKI